TGVQTCALPIFDQALAAADAAQARLAAARARVQADRLRLEYTEVRAPDAGIISVRSAVEGALVQAGEELMRLQRQGRLEWRAQLIGAELARGAPGQVARGGLGGGEGDGRVRRGSPPGDPATRPRPGGLR